MEKVQFWVVSPNVKNNEEENDWKDFISKKPFSCMGWGPEDNRGHTFAEEIKSNDVIINAQRKNWVTTIFSAGVVTSESSLQRIDGMPSEAYIRRLSPYLSKDAFEKNAISFDGATYNGGNRQIPAIYELHPENETTDKEIVEYIKTKLYMEKYMNSLKKNMNIILNGSPGTGKTYLAKNIASQMIIHKDKDVTFSKEEKELLSSHIGFVQFHPSYDYTDFVEGLRPKDNGNDNIGFKLKNGIFKDFCKRALLSYKKEIGEGKKDEEITPYVFIIDEINRGDISKIFGELFFSIDPGYRGINGKVKTQYANLQEGETIFDDDLDAGYFYVPQNVYIIGTMNDIDRSVESMDFAMRRRFTFIEITSEQSAKNMNLNDDQKAYMKRLNDAIFNKNTHNSSIDLSSSYHIGASYFLNVTDFRELWEYKLKPLLTEYLRGMDEAGDKLEKLHKAYNNESA